MPVVEDKANDGGEGHERLHDQAGRQVDGAHEDAHGGDPEEDAREFEPLHPREAGLYFACAGVGEGHQALVPPPPDGSLVSSSNSSRSLLLRLMLPPLGPVASPNIIAQRTAGDPRGHFSTASAAESGLHFTKTRSCQGRRGLNAWTC